MKNREEPCMDFESITRVPGLSSCLIVGDKLKGSESYINTVTMDILEIPELVT